MLKDIICVLAYVSTDWLLTCWLLKLVAICFGLAYDPLAATGFWALFGLYKFIHKDHKEKGKDCDKT